MRLLILLLAMTISSCATTGFNSFHESEDMAVPHVVQEEEEAVTIEEAEAIPSNPLMLYDLDRILRLGADEEVISEESAVVEEEIVEEEVTIVEEAEEVEEEIPEKISLPEWWDKNKAIALACCILLFLTVVVERRNLKRRAWMRRHPE